MSAPLIMFAGLIVFALVLIMFGARSRSKSGTEADVMERMGRFATREEFLTINDGSGKNSPGRIAQSVEEIVNGRSIAERSAVMLTRADVRLTVGEFVLIRMLTAAIGFVAGYLFLSRFAPTFGLMFGLVLAFLGFGAPTIYLSLKARARHKKFVDQLSDTITLMANSLRAGYSLLQTMEMVSRETADPMGTEFRRVVREVGLGVSQEDAMANLLRRVPSDDLDLLVTAINIQHEVGGNLAQILTTIGHTIRERVRIKGEIGVLTAQVQLSGYIITALPIVLALVIFLLNPNYMTALFVWPYICMPIGSVIMIVAGFFVMRKISSIEV